MLRSAEVRFRRESSNYVTALREWNFLFRLGIYMKYMLVILITMGAAGEEPKTLEMRIPQENQEECLKAARTFRFTLPVISVDTRSEPRMDNEEPEVRGVKI